MVAHAVAAEIGLVLYEHCQAAMIHGLTDLLGVASTFSADRGGPVVRVSHWSRASDGSFSRTFDTHEDSPGQPAILVVPGRLTGPPDAAEAAPYARWLLDRHAQGATLASNCGGAFLLAATGLLSGRRATTHWLFADQLQERFPEYWSMRTKS